MEKIKYNYIVIEGNIGAGKTTLASMIARDYNAKLILERFADNPFLPKFYNDPSRYSFPLELSFLADRYRQLKEELVEPDEFSLYRQIFYIIYSSLPKPDLYVYLHVPPERLLKNIAMRGREYEKSITADYLSGIQESYFTFFRQNKENRYLVLDVSNIDFVASHDDYLKVKETIFTLPVTQGINHRNL